MSDVSGTLNSGRRVRDLASRARRAKSSRGDFVFKTFTLVCALVIALIMLGITVALIEGSMPSIRKFGLSFLWTSTWDINKGVYGAVSPLIGTLITGRATVKRTTGVFLLVAGRVDGPVKAVLDWRGGLAFGAAFGLFWALLRRR